MVKWVDKTPDQILKDVEELLKLHESEQPDEDGPQDIWHPNYGLIFLGGKITEAGKEWNSFLKQMRSN